MPFGSGGFGGSSSSSDSKVGTRGRGNRGGLGGGGGGGGNNRGGGGGGGNKNKNKNKGKNPFQDDPLIVTDPFDQTDTGTGDPFAPTPPPNLGGTAGGPGSIFDDGSAATASGSAASYRPTAWGLLNQAGIQQDPIFGSSQSDWLDSQIEDWHSQWEGASKLAGADAQTWDQNLAGRFGAAPPPSGQMNLDWVQNQMGPAARRYLSARYQAQTPRNRGVDTRQWSAPKRTIQF